jgi:hemoglobin
MSTPTLYDRLGGQEGIKRITREIIKNHLANPLVKNRYTHIPDLDRVEKHVVEFFCAGAGGPQTYTGKNMLDTHRGMNISEQEFVTVVDDVMEALATCNVDASTSNEVLAVLWSLKGEVIRV